MFGYGIDTVELCYVSPSKNSVKTIRKKNITGLRRTNLIMYTQNRKYINLEQNQINNDLSLA